MLHGLTTSRKLPLLDAMYMAVCFTALLQAGACPRPWHQVRTYLRLQGGHMNADALSMGMVGLFVSKSARLGTVTCTPLSHAHHTAAPTVCMARLTTVVGPSCARCANVAGAR